MNDYLHRLLPFYATQDYNRFLNIETSSQWKQSTFNGLDVLKFFCLIKKEEIRRACFIPAAQKYKVLVPQQKWYVNAHLK